MASVPAIVASQDRRGARVVAQHPWFQRLTRLGYVVRGLIYLIPGVLALRLAFGTHGAAVTQTEAIELLGHEPLGRLILVVIAVGLGAYSLWGVVRTLFNPLGPRGWMTRLGYASSALGYAGFFLATLRLLMGGSSHSSEDWLTRLLKAPFGPWIVGIIGLGWVGGAGIAEIVKGLSGRFERDLRTERMGPRERKLALWLGRCGIALRGVVLGIIGASMIAAAWHADPLLQRGLGGALLYLSHRRYGRFLMGTTALGLIAFGLFSILCARWARTGAPRPIAPLARSR